MVCHGATAQNLCLVSKGLPTCLSIRLLMCLFIGLGMSLGIAADAAAHSDAELLAAESDYVVKWHQPHGVVPVEYWDLEITPLEGDTRTFVREARVFADESCWGVDVPIDRRARVRIRSATDNRFSAWSRPTVVPEPAFGLSALAGTGLLAAFGRRRRDL